jgi:hypothetical protein
MHSTMHKTSPITKNYLTQMLLVSRPRSPVLEKYSELWFTHKVILMQYFCNCLQMFANKDQR